MPQLDNLARLRAIMAAAKAVQQLTIVRYDHGGGRVFVTSDGPGRELVMEFFCESEREAWFAARNTNPALVALAKSAKELEIAVTPGSSIQLALARMNATLDRELGAAMGGGS